MRCAKIIMVEDESHTRTTLDILLRRAGHKVVSCPDGRKAFELISRGAESPDCDFELLLTDIQMPDMTGTELIHSLKSNGIRIPVIVFTGYGDKDTVVELLREGCDEYLDKPFSESDLLGKINTVLEKERVRKDAESKPEKIMEMERKIDNYRRVYEKICGSVESAVEVYREIIGLSLSSQRLRAALRHHTVDKLGGDFAIMRDNPRGCDVLVADVAGHDMGASYHTIMLKTFFDENCRMGGGGEEYFQALNWQLFNHGTHEKTVSAVFLRVDLEDLRAELFTAGHPYVFRFKAGAPAAALRPVSPRAGCLLGMAEDNFYETRRFNVGPGDRIVIYTDGIPNAQSLNTGTGEKTRLGDTGLRDLLSANYSAGLEEMTDRAWEGVWAFCNHKPSDDMLLLGIEIPS
jgi:DNA-binding response OmpR family regulator